MKDTRYYFHVVMKDTKNAETGTDSALSPVSATIAHCSRGEETMLPWDDDAGWQLSFK